MQTSARCLLAYRGLTSPTAEQRAGATIEAFAFADLHLLTRLLSSK